ncbi:MAG: glycosyltransferase [Lachnospiraceae bacterium]|nr:glycosyltransferase [Lachnospiraceae bacterium]
MKEILFFYTKSICYNSMYAFVNSMVKTLREMGHYCETCTATRPKDLEIYFGRHFDAMVDIDSTLPLMKNDDGEYCLDKIDAPFYNYLLDHPLYYHTALSSKIKRQHVLCIDENHVSYVEKYYDNIQSATFLPLGMMGYEEQLILPLEEREMPLLFTGTYTSEKTFYSRLGKYPQNVEQEIVDIILSMVQNPEMTLEKTMTSYIMEKGLKDPGEKMAELCNRYYLADMGAAASIRAKVIRILLGAGIPVTVCGHGWNKLHCKGEEHLKIIPEKNYMEAVELAYRTKILLNVMPGFKAGIHDRIPTAMGHGAVSCTDGTQYLDEILVNGKNYLKYDIKNLKELPDIIRENLDNQKHLQEIADEGHRIAKELFTWKKRMEEWTQSLPSS